MFSMFAAAEVPAEATLPAAELVLATFKTFVVATVPIATGSIVWARISVWISVAIGVRISIRIVVWAVIGIRISVRVSGISRSAQIDAEVPGSLRRRRCGKSYYREKSNNWKADIFKYPFHDESS